MKKILLYLLMIVMTLPVYAKNSILILGDSISAGYGLNIDQGWVALLQKKIKDKNLNYQIINSSVSGDTTSNGLARLRPALQQHKPTITIIELGANDGLRGLNLLLIKANLTQLVRIAKASGSKVILLGLRLPPNYGTDYTKKFQQIFLDVASSESVPIVPLFLKNIDDNLSLMQQDQIHPNTQAQPLILDNIWPELSKALSL